LSVCVVTNVYNEAFNLPIWLRYYGAQVGIANCLVVDHGSDDGSTDDLRGAGRITLPRSPFDDDRRAAFLGELASSLLRMHDAVIYTDCDEFLVADPARYAGLPEFVAAMKGPAATAIGLNLVQRTDLEGAFDPARPVLAQRGHAQFATAMCKTLVVRAPVRWGAGFHDASLPPAFDGLYLFHLRWVDRAAALRRMAITRYIARANPDHGAHQAMADEQVARRFAALTRLPVDDVFDFAELTTRFVAEARRGDDGLYHAPRDLTRAGLVRVPTRFADSGL